MKQENMLNASLTVKCQNESEVANKCRVDMTGVDFDTLLGSMAEMGSGTTSSPIMKWMDEDEFMEQMGMENDDDDNGLMVVVIVLVVLVVILLGVVGYLLYALRVAK